MCLHTKTDLVWALGSTNHQLSANSKYAVVWFEGPNGEVRGWNCIGVEPESAAQTIKDLRNWHSEIDKNWKLHLEHWNLQRLMHGLDAVKEEDLPEPKAEAA